jgi:serine/threonine protein kinase
VTELIFTWVHLSGLEGLADFPLGDGSDVQKQHGSRIRDAICRDLHTLQEKSEIRPDVVFVTGNVHAGAAGAQRADSRNTVSIWLKQLTLQLGGSLNQIMLVPGTSDVHDLTESEDPNHGDINRVANPPIIGRRTFALDTILETPSEKKMLAKRMPGFLELSAECQKNLSSDSSDRLYWTDRVEGKRELKIKIVGLNTVLLRSDQETPGLLGALGNDQLRSISRSRLLAHDPASDVDADEFVIVLSHHPIHPRWLEDANDALNRMIEHAHVHLSADHGEAPQISTGGKNYVISRATGPWKKKYHYEVAQLLHDAGGGLVTRVWPRVCDTTSSSSVEFVADTVRAPDGHADYPVRPGISVVPMKGDTFAHRRYKLIDKCTDSREGSIAQVWSARELDEQGVARDSGKFAIKILNTFDATQSSRFKAESQALRDIKLLGAKGDVGAKHVVSHIESGEDSQGRLFTVMELLEGIQLSKYLFEKRVLVPNVAAEFCRQIALGLNCFGPRWTHRDLKPENIYITRDSSGTEILKILDFGSARERTETRKTLTAVGQLVGTRGYMSPEQFSRGGKVDHRSDTWSLAVILYEMLLGELPFSEEDRALKARFKRIPADSPVANLRGIEAFFQKALASSPNERFQSAVDLDHAFRAIVGVAGVVAPASVWKEQLNKYWMRTAAGVAFLGLLSVAIVARWIRWPFVPTDARSSRSEESSFPSTVIASAVSMVPSSVPSVLLSGTRVRIDDLPEVVSGPNPGPKIDPTKGPISIVVSTQDASDGGVVDTMHGSAPTAGSKPNNFDDIGNRLHHPPVIAELQTKDAGK